MEMFHPRMTMRRLPTPIIDLKKNKENNTIKGKKTNSTWRPTGNACCFRDFVRRQRNRCSLKAIHLFRRTPPHSSTGRFLSFLKRALEQFTFCRRSLAMTAMIPLSCTTPIRKISQQYGSASVNGYV